MPLLPVWFTGQTFCSVRIEEKRTPRGDQTSEGGPSSPASSSLSPGHPVPLQGQQQGAGAEASPCVASRCVASWFWGPEDECPSVAMASSPCPASSPWVSLAAFGSLPLPGRESRQSHQRLLCGAQSLLRWGSWPGSLQCHTWLGLGPGLFPAAQVEGSCCLGEGDWRMPLGENGREALESWAEGGGSGFEAFLRL